MIKLAFEDVIWGLSSVIIVHLSMYYTYTYLELAVIWLLYVLIAMAVLSDFTAFGAQFVIFEISSVIFGVPLLLVSAVCSIIMLFGVAFYKIPNLASQIYS